MKPLIKQTFVLAQNTDSTSEYLLTDDSELHLLGYRSSTECCKGQSGPQDSLSLKTAAMKGLGNDFLMTFWGLERWLGD